MSDFCSSPSPGVYNHFVVSGATDLEGREVKNDECSHEKKKQQIVRVSCTKKNGIRVISGSVFVSFSWNPNWNCY